MAYQRRIRDLVLDSDLDSLKEELELNEDLVTIEIGRGNTLLHFACYENVDDSIAKWLIANGADMEVVNYDDDKPIGNDNNEVSSFIKLSN
jgi:ankyrin repeat protein